MVSDIKRIENDIRKLSNSDIKEIVDEDAKHNEAACHKHFSQFYECVFCNERKKDCLE